MNDAADLFSVCNYLHIAFHIIGIYKLNPSCLKFKTYLLRTVSEIVLHIQLTEGIGNAVCIYLGIKSKLIYKVIHLICFIINGFYISFHFFRCICNAVHNSFHISFYRCDRSFQIMGNITDKLFVLFIQNNLFLCRLLQPDTHIFEILKKLCKFIISLYIEDKVQIPLFNIPGSFFQFQKRSCNASVNPKTYRQGSTYKDNGSCQKQIFRHYAYLHYSI